MKETAVLVRLFPEGLEGWMKERKLDENGMVIE